MFPTRCLLGRSVWKGSLFLLSQCNWLVGDLEKLTTTCVRITGPNIVPYVQPIHFTDETSSCRFTNLVKPLYSLPLPRTLPPPPGTPPIRTQARSATILPNFVGLRFAVHNGKIYQDVLITEEMVGRKLGEFVA